MKSVLAHLFLAIGLIFAASSALPVAVYAQSDAEKLAQRDETREKLRDALDQYGPAQHITFRQSDKEPYNFVGTLTEGLKNAEMMEIVISVTAQNTIGFRVYPHYNKGYINQDKARNSAALMRQLLHFSDSNFMFWGADDTGDIFSGFTFTLESGFPKEAIGIVIDSIKDLDIFVGQMRPSYDGTSAL